uniref:Uncharacterized protein n=1 Tax=Rhizophora mucronata TaxID=61149 RepID=A0A2P2PAB2_RHIMU
MLTRFHGSIIPTFNFRIVTAGSTNVLPVSIQKFVDFSSCYLSNP